MSSEEDEPNSGEFDGSLSIISYDSMVEIKHPDVASSTGSFVEDEKYRLLYSKSKVYVHPTAYARDNIPGFVVLVKREAINATYLLAWIPETLLNEKGKEEWDKFVRIEEKISEDDDYADAVLIDLPIQRPETYAFSVPLTSIYSLIVHPPSLSSWHGSMAINLLSGSTLPTLYFHDDESRSFTASPLSPGINRRDPINHYPPIDPNLKPTTWGGEDLMARLRTYAHLLRSTLQPSLFLVDPSKADIETHTTPLFADDAIDDILAQSSYAHSFSPVPAHRRPKPLSSESPMPSNSNPYSNRSSVLHRSLQPVASPASPSQARAALMQSFSNITRATRHAAQNILSHPLAKPIIPHLPDPVRSLVSANGDLEWGSWVEKGGVGEFESARIYLARWARIVAEEGERARRREAQLIPASPGERQDGRPGEETGSLGVFELLHSSANLPKPTTTRDPRHPIEVETWEGWFDRHGKPRIKKDEMLREVFRKGVTAKGDLRKRVWPFVLGILEWDSTDDEREKAWEEKIKQYQHLKSEWCGVDEVFNRQDIIEERHRIDVDCRRTDRTQPLFVISSPMVSPSLSESSNLNSSPTSNTDDSPRPTPFSPNIDAAGAQAPTNDHVERLGGILLTYNIYEKELDNEGYVQGMSDLCAPIYVVMGANEEMTFWCFVEVMNRMKQNFLRDQSGMKKHLLTLQQLIRFMDPELYRHLDKTDGLNLFFCFRWVLIAFKREFPFDDVLRLWEVLWTNSYSTNFVLFVALAILESHRDVILRYLVEFDEVLKYCNELSMTIELDTTLAQAEVLFLSFSQLISDIDRRRAEADSSSSDIRRRSLGRGTSNKNSIDVPVIASSSLPEIGDNLRELLKHGEMNN